MSRVTAVAIAYAFMTGSAALAQTGFPPSVSDGSYVTLEEIRANSKKVFTTFAGPGGGPIRRETFVTRDLPPGVKLDGKNQELLPNLFTALDGNGDGLVTRAEWNSRIEMDIAFADENGDGRITLKELANARENMGISDAVGMLF